MTGKLLFPGLTPGATNIPHLRCGLYGKFIFGNALLPLLIFHTFGVVLNGIINQFLLSPGGYNGLAGNAIYYQHQLPQKRHKLGRSPNVRGDADAAGGRER